MKDGHLRSKKMKHTYNNIIITGSEGQIGPKLDHVKPSIDQIIYVVNNGIGVMQAWEGILTKEEIEAVAYYVFNNTNN